MDLRRAIPVVHTEDPIASRRFYEEFLGFEVRMEQDGMLMLASPTVATTQVIVGWESPTAMDDALLTVDLSIEVDDVDAAYATAQADGLAIVRSIRDEPWGIRRFFVRDPGGQIVNVAMHR